jgi:fructokinase
MSWGHIQDTPKRAWAGFDLAGAVADAAGAPVVLETDVGAAALAEAAIAGGEALVAYATVGTGIGVGLAQGGRVLRGKRHGEGGHVPILPHAAMGKSVCPFHADCLEGLASGPAIQSHWGAPLDRLPEDHAGRAAIADALAQLCVGLLYAVSPDRIVLGGGVMTGGALLPAIRAAAQARMGGYHVPPGGLDAVITGPRSAIAPGLAGALLLAERAA